MSNKPNIPSTPKPKPIPIPPPDHFRGDSAPPPRTPAPKPPKK